MTGWTIDIDRKDIAHASVQALDLPPLEDGQIAVSIDSMGLTANNVTYAVFGQHAPDFGTGGGYWDFFSEPDEPGKLPMWGYATVTQSKCEGISQGDVYYGYLPMASDTILTIGANGKRGFTDVTPRRVELPSLYNKYQLVSQFRDYRPEDHDLWPIYRGLFFTAWFIIDQCEDENDFGSEQILITSASSKTAICSAYLHTQRPGAKARLIGVTSKGNVEYVRSLGLYDDVVTYDSIEDMDPSHTTTLIDIAGNIGVVSGIHSHFKEKLVSSIAVGFSHWDADRPEGDIYGIQPKQFFVPTRSKKRATEWGGARLAEAMATSWLSFMGIARSFTQIDRKSGGQEALAAYLDAVSGRTKPRGAVIIERGI